MRNQNYKLNFPALVFLVGAIVVLAGGLGGTDFERGVAGLLVLMASDVLSFTVEGTDPWLKLVVMALMPLAIGVYAWGLYLVLTGMS